MHDHHQSGHHHHHHTAGRRLMWALRLTLAFAILEVVGGLWSGSLALLGDAGHMVTDAVSLGLAAFASWLSQRPPTHSHSYGLGRAEVLAALFNALLMLGVVTGIGYEAVQRFTTPSAVQGEMVMVIAAAGLACNIAVALILSSGHATLNTRGALLHVMGDLLGSVAALVAGAVIYFTGWTPIDPLLALLVCVLILFSTWHLLSDSLRVVMEGVPPDLDLAEIGTAMAGCEAVLSVHDLHIWTLSSGRVALSAHVVIRDMTQWQATLDTLLQLLEHRYHIAHVTLQPETRNFPLQPMAPPMT